MCIHLFTFNEQPRQSAVMDMPGLMANNATIFAFNCNVEKSPPDFRSVPDVDADPPTVAIGKLSCVV